MSLQAALSKLRRNPPAVPRDKHPPDSALTVNHPSPPPLSSRAPSCQEGPVAVRGAFNIPFDGEEDDDDGSSFGLPGGWEGPPLESGQREAQSGHDQAQGGPLGAVEKMQVYSFAEVQKQSLSSNGVPSGKTLITEEGVSTGQWEAPGCAVDKEEELLLALDADWMDSAWVTGPGGKGHGMGEDEGSHQPQCQLDRNQAVDCRGRGLLGGVRQEQPAVKRRFPGPAGALPRLPPGQSLTQLLARQPKRAPKTPCLSSRQGSCEYHRDNEVTDFSTGPWRDMESDLQIDSTLAAPLRKFTVSKVLKQAARKRLPSGKVPHLRVRVKTVHRGGRNARVILHDPTGEVCGTVHCEVLEEVGASLGPGAVVLLRQVSVVSPKPRRHHLNITASNLVALYPAQGGRWTAGGGSFDLSKVISEALANSENKKTDFPCNGSSGGGSPLFSGHSRPMVSVNAPPTNWLCESHDQQPISLLPPDTSGTDGLDDLEGVTIADLDEWDSPEEEGPPKGQRQGSGGQTGGNASESTGSFFSDLLREDELTDFNEF